MSVNLQMELWLISYPTRAESLPYPYSLALCTTSPDTFIHGVCASDLHKSQWKGLKFGICTV